MRDATRGRLRMAAKLSMVFAGLAAAGALSGCLMIGGSSRGGFFLWPGGLGLLVLVVVLAMVLRRR